MNFWNNALPQSRVDRLLRHDPMTLLRRAAEAPRGGIKIGEDFATGLDVYLAPDDIATHAQVLGATGVGKTRGGIENIAKHLILNPYRGGCLMLTPHEDLFRNILEFCAYLHMKRPELKLNKRVIPIDFGDTRRVVGYNVASRNAREIGYHASTMVEVIYKAWGQSDYFQTPRLGRWLHNAAFAVIEGGLTMVQAKRLVDKKPHPVRDAIVRRIKDPDIRAEWEYITHPKFQRPGGDDVLESALNRLTAFCSNEIVRRSLGQYTHTFNMPAVVHDDSIVLLNLDGRNFISDSNRNLIGTFFVSELLTAVFARKPAYRKPFHLLIDEAQFFVTSDMCPILDGGRKFGLRCVATHQHLGQFRERHPDVYYSLLSNARTKLVFGGLSDEDLDVIAKELYVGELDPNEIKHEIWQTKYEPVESSRVIVSESESDGGSDSVSDMTHESLIESASFYPDSGFINPQTISTAAGLGQGSAASYGSSWSRSQSRTEVPFYEYHAYRELSSRQFRSLEEQLYIKKAQLKRQPRQHAALLVPGEQVKLIRTPTLRDFRIADRHLDEFKYACWEAAGCFARPEDAEAEITALETKLLEPIPIEVNSKAEARATDVDPDDDYS